jgi:acetoin utilization protein AcuB
MNVADIMTLNPVTIRHNGTLRQALELMDTAGCRHLPVMSVDGHLVGIVSDRDCRLALNSPHIMREKWQDEEVLHQTAIAAIMSPAPIIVEPDAPAEEAARLMLSNSISALPVMRGETLIGIVTTSDVLVAFMNLSKHIRSADDHLPT